MSGIKVFLVEDEMIIRNGVKRSIDWEKEGYEFVGEASDGELAYPLILKEKPDIMITDIRMPFMDGLELSRLVKTELPNIKILILSGYDEFQYAKEAIKIGVTDYLLKPISSAKLLEALGQVKENILQEREEKELLLRYSRDMQENTENEKSKLFDRLMIGEMSMGEAVEEGKKFGLNLSASCYAVCLFKILMNSDEKNLLEQTVQASEELEGEVKQIEGVCMFQRGISGLAFLVMEENEEKMREKIRDFSNCLHCVMDQWKELEYFGAVGKSVDRIRNLKDSFREADKVFASRFTEKPKQILSIADLQVQKEEGEVPVKGFVQVGKTRTVLEKFLNNGTKEEVNDFCEAYAMQLEKDHMRSAMVRQYVVMDICIVILSFCEKLSDGEELQKEVQELQTAIQRNGNVREIKENLKKLLVKVIEVRDMASGRRYSDIIMAAKEEIEKHYMTEEISLNTVAMHVGMSPSYFSSIFSKEAGKMFVEYLTEVRMEKAREYLMCSSMKTSEIGYEVGYKDPHYFSYIFKKTQGCSPKEYRARRKG